MIELSRRIQVAFMLPNHGYIFRKLSVFEGIATKSEYR